MTASFFKVFVLTGGLLAAAATVPACSSGNLHHLTETAGNTQSISDTFFVCNPVPGGIRVLDIFIYRDTLTKPLEAHRRLEAPDGMDCLFVCHSFGGDRIAIAIANSPAPFREEALERCEGAEQLEMYYRMEDPAFPLMTAVQYYSEGPVPLRFKPLLCKVNIVGISNFTGGPLSDVRLRLRGVNSHVQMLRAYGFRTVETEDEPAALAHPEMMSCRLDCDIGESPVYPGSVLWCYPFDGEGPSSTGLTISALAGGATREWSFAVPPLGRAQETYLAPALE